MAGWVKSSAQHAAVNKGSSSELFEEEGFENNPEKYYDAVQQSNCRSPAGVLQPDVVIPFVRRGGGHGERNDQGVDEGNPKGCVSL